MTQATAAPVVEANEAVYDRIAKLLAMANNEGASENERNMAQDHVQRLMMLHNLTLSQIESASGQKTTEKREKRSFGSAVRPWQLTIMAALAKSNFCLHQISASPGQGQPRRHLIVGRAVNVQATQMVYDYLLGALRRELAAAGYTETEPRVTSRGTKYSKEGQWFLEGAATRLEDRLEEKRRQAERESKEREEARRAQGNGTGKELVLSDVYGTEADLNNDALNNFPPGTTAARRRKRQEEVLVREARHAELVKSGKTPMEANYITWGYSEEEAKTMANEWQARQDAVAKAPPSRSRYRSRARSWNTGRDTNHYRMIGSAAYQQGKNAGDSIGLDPQVSAKSVKRITKQ